MDESRFAERFYQYTPEERRRIYGPHSHGNDNPD
jgi:hypothetical protein